MRLTPLILCENMEIIGASMSGGLFYEKKDRKPVVRMERKP